MVDFRSTPYAGYAERRVEHELTISELREELRPSV